MDPQIYLDMIEHQKTHWWFRARRAILSRVISSLGVSKECRILEIGSGMGGNFSMLQKHGNLSAIEIDKFAVNYTRQNFNVNVSQGSLPDDIDVVGKFDIICLFDVLEHVEEDQQALVRIASLLASNGVLLMTVPAHQWLYGSHDKYLHHFRRYAKRELLEKIQHTRLSIEKISYFNSILFPLVVIGRIWDILKNAKEPVGYAIPSPLPNRTLHNIFSIERLFLTKINLPIGASLIAVARKSF